MLEYEWGGNPSTIILSPAGDEPITHQTDEHDNNNTYQTDLNRHYFLNINNPFNEHESSHSHSHSHSHLVNNNIPQPTAHHHPSLFPVHQPAAPQHINPYFDPRAYTLQDHQNQQNYFLIPKSEEVFTSRIGLNLGGRTYFSSADQDDLVSRLYRRSRPPALLYPPISSASRCQAEGCNADLTHAKHYHRRHKVCEFHSKASTVIAHGLTQRFCQQCSRFHLLSEFDNGKRSCRKRLADHNRRRRKSNQANQDISRNKPPQTESARNSPSHTVTRTLPDSGVQSSSSVTVALSPRRMSFDYFNQRPYQAAVPATMTSASNFSASSSSLFYSGG